ncbi:MAG: tyrosinase family protein [Egibacteraceae bacterium]
MAVVRHNILKDTTSREQFIKGVNLLKREFPPGITTEVLQFPPPSIPVSTYDLFVLWHHLDMTTETPPRNPTGRNFAHLGPIFLPWHRFMLLLLEAHLRRVLEDPSFGLPYWDWTADGDLTVPPTDLWTIDDAVGGTGDPVTTGPFKFDAENPSDSFRVFFEFEGFIGGILLDRAGRGLRRQLGEVAGLPLPTTGQVSRLLTESDYDREEWDGISLGFRNHLEAGRFAVGNNGLVPSRLHNGVHGWVSGDMGLTTSPNDPVFYLHHCNVDRIWEAWLTRRGRTYVPTQATPGAPEGHRLEDKITSFVVGGTTTPADMLDVSALYEYDVLPA